MHRTLRYAGVFATLFVTVSAFGQTPETSASPEAPPPPAAEPARPAVAPHEAAEEPFGKAGVLNIASDLALSVQHIGYSDVHGSSPESVTTYEIGPAADYFVIDNYRLELRSTSHASRFATPR
jgi:hypothetical protein